MSAIFIKDDKNFVIPLLMDAHQAYPDNVVNRNNKKADQISVNKNGSIVLSRKCLTNLPNWLGRIVKRLFGWETQSGIVKKVVKWGEENLKKLNEKETDVVIKVLNSLMKRGDNAEAFRKKHPVLAERVNNFIFEAVIQRDASAWEF